VEDNIKMGHKDVGWEVVDWLMIRTPGERGLCEHSKEPSCSIRVGDFLNSSAIISFM
jgi:hypothetical protein